MAINPSLVSIKKVEDIPTVPLSELATGQMFGYTGGGVLKKVATSEILDFVKSDIKGIATQTNAPTPYDAVTYPDGLFETYIVRTPITSPNSWGDFTVTQNELDNNFIYFDVNNGVVTKILSLKPAVKQIYQSDNIFDKTTIVPDFYVGGSGDLSPATGWFYSEKIPVIPNTQINNWTNLAGAFYDANDNFIAPRISASITQFTVPANAVYFRATDFISGHENKVLSVGKESQYSTLKIETGAKTISKDLLPPSVLSKKGNNIVVSVRGGGDFRWINDALDWLRNSGENDVYNPFTFEIIDGEYVESVDMCGLYLSLVGRNRENCIIKNYLNDYYFPPIDMAGNNHLSNLTIIADDNGTTTPPLGVDGLPAYGIHFDIAGRLEGLGYRVQGRSVVKNCRIISKHQHAVGQGLWTDTESIWEDCEFYSPTSPAFRSHSYMPAGATNQKFFMKNCIAFNGGTEPPIIVQDPNLAGGNDSFDTVYTFINNTAWNDLSPKNSNDLFSGHDLTGGGTLSGKIKLGKGSFGNNVPKLNL